MARATSSWGRLPRRLASMAMALLCLSSVAAFAQAVPPRDAPSEAVHASRPADRRTMALLPANLARSVTGVFAAASLRPLLIGAPAAGIAFVFDDRVRDSIGNPESDVGRFGDTAGGLVVGGSVAALFVAGRLSSHQPFRAATYDMLTGALTTQGFTALIKVAVGRTRPNGPTSRASSSFPSGHSSSAFALATVIERHFGPRAWVPAYAVSSLIAASRVRYSRHYLSDIVAGATLGIIVGRASVRMNGRPLPASSGAGRTVVSISTLGGAGVNVAITF